MLFLRVASTLDRSAQLAEQDAEHAGNDTQRRSAELEVAARARAAAERGRVLADQLR